jgi:hypothetical protein
MATQTKVRDEDLNLARPFLAERGIEPDATGRYPEQAIIDALRERGWDVEVTGAPGDWTVEFRDRADPTQEPSPVTSASDRASALLRALHLALTWMTPEEERQYFDVEARRLLGMSGEDAMLRWNAGELDREDPSVRHHFMLRPSGW